MPANVCDDEFVLKGSCFDESIKGDEEYEEDEIKAALCALSTPDDALEEEISRHSDDDNSYDNIDDDDDYDGDDDDDDNDDVINIELQIEDDGFVVTPEESGELMFRNLKQSCASGETINKLAMLPGPTMANNGNVMILAEQPKQTKQTNNPSIVYVQYIPVPRNIQGQATGFFPNMHHFVPIQPKTASVVPSFQPSVTTNQQAATTVAERVGATSKIDEDSIPLSQISKIARQNALEQTVNANRSKDVEKPHKCKVCGVGFQWISHLQRHEKTHSNEKYMCNICHAGFSQFGYFKAHRRTHFAEKPYKCDKCDKTFVQSTHLKIHKMIHTGEKPYQCYVCKARFTQHGNLKRHIRTHTGERPFKCTVCPASFTHSSDLTRHVRIHTGERPYKCQFCATAFATNGNLKSHLKIHTTRKIFKCTVCRASFNLESYLKAHMRTHTGEKPFVCACGQSFTQGLSFKFHLRAKMSPLCGKN